MTSCLALTFHGLENQAQEVGLPGDQAGRHYTVSSELFKESLNVVARQQSCTVDDFLMKESSDWTVITFDDGLISDYEIAFPLLAEHGLVATFFVTATNVGSSGYISQIQLREMAEAGMEIGSHGLTHSYLVNMESDQVQKEITESRDRLEQIVGKQVHSFAPVGGHFAPAMLQVAMDAGYSSFASMVPGITYLEREYFILRRNHLKASHDTLYLQKLLSRDKVLLVKNSLRYQVLFLAKRILGMRRYDQMKSLFVEEAA